MDQSRIDALFEMVRELQIETSNIWIEIEKIQKSIDYAGERIDR